MFGQPHAVLPGDVIIIAAAPSRDDAPPAVLGEEPAVLRNSRNHADATVCGGHSSAMLCEGGSRMARTVEIELDAVKREVLALRDALEVARDEAAASVQRDDAEHQGEVDQLQAMITALRGEMVRQREELLAKLQAAERDHATDAEQLRDAVAAARRHADELQQQHEIALAQQLRQFETERRDLHDTIAELRRRLESTTSDARR